MKHEFGVENMPRVMKESWPGQFNIFCWFDYVINMPLPLYLITTYKENGLPNACFHSWCHFEGNGKSGQYVILGLNVGGHTYQNIKRTGAFCINYPSYDDLSKCQATIDHNELEDDEIAAGGFTAEESKRVEAPRIAECSLSLECSYVKECQIDKDYNSNLVFGKVLHIGAGDAVVQADLRKRIQQMDLMLNFREQINPLSGESAQGGSARIDSSSFRHYQDPD